VDTTGPCCSQCFIVKGGYCTHWPRSQASVGAGDGRGVGAVLGGSVGDGEGAGRGGAVGCGTGCGDGRGEGSGKGSRVGAGLGCGLGRGVGEGEGCGEVVGGTDGLARNSPPATQKSASAPPLPLAPPPAAETEVPLPSAKVQRLATLPLVPRAP